MIKKFLISISLILFYGNAFGSALDYPYQLTSLKYDFVDSKKYDAYRIKLDGNLTIADTNNFSYKLGWNKINEKENIATIDFGYAKLIENSWFGFALSSTSNKPFSRFDLVDFDLFYTYKILDSFHGTSAFPDDFVKSRYHRLYFGVMYSSKQMFGDFPMPVLRYENVSDSLRLVLGYPLNYMHLRITNVHSFEIKYVPVMELLLSYNITFNSFNGFAFQFEIENTASRLSYLGPKSYSKRLRFFEEYYWVRFKYQLNVKNVVRVSPYVQMLVYGRQYVGRSTFNNIQDEIKTGIGYSIGTSIEIAF